MWIIAKLNPRRMLGETFGRLTVIKEAPKDKWDIFDIIVHVLVVTPI